jgi:heme oxygenase
MLETSAVVSPPSVLESLRAATRSRHAKLETCRDMARLFDADYSLPEYKAHLGRLLGFFEPLEEHVSRVAGPSDLALTVQRTHDLREDLMIMGATATEIAALERCRRVPQITSQGLPGYTYVILGSSLGAKVIVKKLRATLGEAASLRFYGDANGRSAALWHVFLQSVELQSVEKNGRDNIQEICATASKLFDAYEAWLCH